jgi:hypothetical protein
VEGSEGASPPAAEAEAVKATPEAQAEAREVAAAGSPAAELEVEVGAAGAKAVGVMEAGSPVELEVEVGTAGAKSVGVMEAEAEVAGAAAGAAEAVVVAAGEAGAACLPCRRRPRSGPRWRETKAPGPPKWRSRRPQRQAGANRQATAALQARPAPV